MSSDVSHYQASSWIKIPKLLKSYQEWSWYQEISRILNEPPEAAKWVQQDFVGKELPDRAPQHPADACALLVEANKGDSRRGMQGFQIPVAKHLNAAISKGKPGPRRWGTLFPVDR